MPARSKRSKKRSAASSTPQPDLTFFLDECLGTRHVPDALAHAGAQVLIHRQHFANQPGVADHDLDFGTILALTCAKGLSIIQVRAQGAIVTVDESRGKVRMLPIGRG